MKFWCTPSIITNFKNARMPKDGTEKLTIDAARNEIVSAQILLRSDCDFRVAGMQMANIRGDFDLDRVKICAQQYLLFNDQVAYPDPIANTIEVSVKQHATQALWISFDIPGDQPAGEYEIQVVIFTNVGEYRPYFTIHVYDVSIPPPEKGTFNMEYFLGLDEKSLFNEKGYEFEIFDEKWWAFLENYARSLRECRINILILPLINLLIAAGSKRVNKQEWVLDFTLMDKFIKFMLAHAGTKRIICSHLFSFQTTSIFSINEKGKITNIPVDDPDAVCWVNTLLKKLYLHLVENGWDNIWLMHLQDEPQNAESWQWMREKVRENMPGVCCGDAIGKALDHKLDGYMDVYIPLFPLFEQDQEYFDKQRSLGKEIWAYCCCGPEDPWWLNKFIDLPHRYSRYIAWACFSQDITGFYNKFSAFFGTAPDSRFKGDDSLIYPSPEDNGVRVSSRYIETRDGAQDFELLKIVESKNPGKAKELSKAIARSFSDFTSDPEIFMSIRRQLLEAASNVS